MSRESLRTFPEPGAPKGRESVRPNRWITQVIPVFVLVASGVVVYANSFQGVFVYDDIRHIVEDERIRQLWPPSHWWPHRRPVVVVSLALNFALGKLNPWGYHLFNLVVHLLSGLVMFGLIRNTLTLPDSASRRIANAEVAARESRSPPGKYGSWFALVAALLWVVHPIQTQSVTYVIQRGESLMGLFYLLTLYCVLRGATVRRGATIWYVAAVVSCALGMGSKAVMLTAPLVVLLYDRIFLSQTMHEVLRRRWSLYLGLAATWGVLVITGVVRGTLAPQQADAVMGFGYKGATPWTYLLTQAEVIPHYLRLTYWPDPLCLDYNWPVVGGVGDVAWPGAIVVGLLFVTLWLLIRHPRLGFLGAWFFLILAPTSSVVPIQDPIYEHRMYLPLAGVIVLTIVGVRSAFARLPRLSPRARNVGAAILVVSSTIALGLATMRRNAIYASDLALWRDVVATRPQNARAQYNLGNALRDRGDLDGARSAYQAAVRISPRMVMARNNLGNVLRLQGRIDEAIDQLQNAVDIDPDYAEGYVNLAAARADAGAHAEAVESGRRACALDPDRAEAHFNLGMSLGALGRWTEAIDSFETSVRLMEAHSADARVLSQAYYFLGITLARVDRVEQARRTLDRALELNPDDARIRAARDRLAG